MKRFKNILFVTEPTARDGLAFDRVVTLAEGNQARLTVVSLLEGAPAGDLFAARGVSAHRLHGAMVDKRQRHLDELIAPVSSRIDVHAKVLIGTHFLAIIREVLRNQRDLVMKASSEDAGIGARVFGSTDMHLLRKCPCPVWLMLPGKSAPYRRIFTAIDFDPYNRTTGEEALNRQILEMAASLALSEFAELHIVHAWRAFGESELNSGFADVQQEEVDAYVARECRIHETCLYRAMEEFLDSAGKSAMDYLKPQAHLNKGWAHQVIPELATELQADLIVMGTVARTGVPGLIIGNTAEAILNRVHCSILVIKPDGFVTPVTLKE
ncbi:MAG: universal stress protein [Gammaproteobacteria bacterium]|nr:universal stress protein [Gammaproteobacteria bacterium]